MQSISLTATADEQLAAARRATNGRAARTVYGGRDHVLRQTVLALLADRELAEHDTPGEATLQVIRGRVLLTAGDETWEGSDGDHIAIPAGRHALHAVEDAVVLLTVASPR